MDRDWTNCVGELGGEGLLMGERRGAVSGLAVEIGARLCMGKRGRVGKGRIYL